MRLYHNPRCSKSRQAFSLLESKGIEFEDYRYLDNGILSDDFEVLLALDGIIRTNDLEPGTLFNPQNKKELQKLLTINPKLLQRPVLIHDGKAIIGRPPEEILTLLHDI